MYIRICSVSRTGPSGFDGCLNRFIPLDADVALLGFNDVCTHSDLPLHNSTFGLALESIVRELASRARPPVILFFNFHKFTSCATAALDLLSLPIYPPQLLWLLLAACVYGARVVHARQQPMRLLDGMRGRDGRARSVLFGEGMAV